MVSPKDLTRLACFLQISESEVIHLYGEYSGKKLKLRSALDGGCIFFTKEEGCSVHEGKPSICRAWPFFRGNLIDSTSYAMAKDFCCGLKRDVSHEDFVLVGHRYLISEGLVATDPSIEANALIL